MKKTEIDALQKLLRRLARVDDICDETLSELENIRTEVGIITDRLELLIVNAEEDAKEE